MSKITHTTLNHKHHRFDGSCEVWDKSYTSSGRYIIPHGRAHDLSKSVLINYFGRFRMDQPNGYSKKFRNFFFLLKWCSKVEFYDRYPINDNRVKLNIYTTRNWVFEIWKKSWPPYFRLWTVTVVSSCSSCISCLFTNTAIDRVQKCIFQKFNRRLLRSFIFFSIQRGNKC